MSYKLTKMDSSIESNKMELKMDSHDFARDSSTCIQINVQIQGWHTHIANTQIILIKATQFCIHNSHNQQRDEPKLELNKRKLKIYNKTTTIAWFCISHQITHRVILQLNLPNANKKVSRDSHENHHKVRHGGY